MKIFIPSYKRAGKVKTAELVPSAYIACHAFEATEYKKLEKNKLMILPDALRGNIAKVRNYILDNAKDTQIVMLDDDIINIGHFEGRKWNNLAAHQVLDFLSKGYQVAKDLNLTLWGIMLSDDRMFYKR